jgi:PAS domain S-box-containing protein
VHSRVASTPFRRRIRCICSFTNGTRMATSTPAPGSEPDRHNALDQFKALLASERALRARVQSELDLRNCALDAATTHCMIGDVSRPHWAIVYVNRAIARDYGYEPSEIVGRTPAWLSQRGPNTEAFERIDQAVHAGNSVSIELVARRKDGSTFWVGIFMTPVGNAAGVINHYLCIGSDITVKLEQQRAQRALQEQLYSEMREREQMAIELRLAQKLESVGRLAAGVAHEINTPIQYIGDSVLFLQSAATDLRKLQMTYRAAFQRLLNNEPIQDVEPAVLEAEAQTDLEFLFQEIPKAFERTLEGVERVAGIVRAMKEFAHPDSVEQSSADINHAIQTTLTVAHTEYKYSAQLETRFGDLPLVICNIGELNQVFLNLIVNASHAITESGKDVATGRIIITTSASGSDVVICVEDNGCGIPTENVDKVFDPFFTTKPVGRGTGQGLAIARSIVVEKHGGSIDIQSVVGGGTNFIIRLPAEGRSSKGV